MENTELLRKISFFQGFSAMELLPFNRIIESKTVKEGEQIIHQGDQGDAVYVIKHGSADVFFTNNNASEPVLLSSLKEMDHFGEMSLLDDSPRSATVIATTDTSLIIIKRKDLEKILQDDAEFAARFYREVAVTIAKRLRSANNTIYAASTLLATFKQPQ